MIAILNMDNIRRKIDEFIEYGKLDVFRIDVHKYLWKLGMHDRDLLHIESHFVSSNKYLINTCETPHIILTSYSPTGGGLHHPEQNDFDTFTNILFDRNLPCIILLSSVDGSTGDYHIHIMTEEEQELFYNNDYTNKYIRDYCYRHSNEFRYYKKTFSYKDHFDCVGSGSTKLESYMKYIKRDITLNDVLG